MKTNQDEPVIKTLLKKGRMMKNIEALDSQAMQQIRMRQAVIAQYELVVNALKNEIMLIVQASSGVNVFEEDWEIDLDRGILRKVENKANEAKDCAP